MVLLDQTHHVPVPARILANTSPVRPSKTILSHAAHQALQLTMHCTVHTVQCVTHTAQIKWQQPRTYVPQGALPLASCNRPLVDKNPALAASQDPHMARSLDSLLCPHQHYCSLCPCPPTASDSPLAF